MNDWWEFVGARRSLLLLSATHELVLPGVSCDVCGESWAGTGVSFPNADLTRLEFLRRVKPNVPWARYEELRKRAASELPALANDLSPGAGFGRVVEKMRRRERLPAYFLDAIAGLLVNEDVARRLTAEGLMSFGERALLRGPRDEPPMFEADLPLAGAQPVELRLTAKQCAQCGYLGGRGYGWHHTVIAASSPPGVHAFRFREFTTVVLVDDLVREALLACDPSVDPFARVTLI